MGRQTYLAALGVVFLLSAALRVAASSGDLWLDEIMSLNAARGCQNILQIFSLNHDNNHLLNSVWLFLLSGVDNPMLLRGFSLLSGFGTLFLLLTWPETRTRGAEGGSPLTDTFDIERVLRMLMIGASYPLVLYDSEARGYATMMFGGLLAWRVLWVGAFGFRAALIFWIGSGLCVLGHSSGVQWHCALLVWSLVTVWLSPARGVIGRSLALFHLPVIIGVGILWLGFISQLPAGSGSLRSWYEVLVSALSIGFGGPLVSELAPEVSLLALLIAIVVLVLIIRALVSQWNQDRRFAITCLTGIALVPIAAVVLFDPRVIYERYFLSSLVFIYFLLARFAADLWHKNSVARAVVAVALVMFVIGQALNLASLMAHHRGSYKSLLVEVLAVDSADPLVVTRDHSFRIDLVSRYYQQQIEGGERLVFQHDPLARWHIVHSQDSEWLPPPFIPGPEGASLEKVSCRFSAPLSGWSWCAYRAAVERELEKVPPSF